jgi:hypothetical protein
MCSNHGTCTGGACSCSTNFQGSECENMTAPLGLGVAVDGFVTSSRWNYFYFVANTETSLLFSLDVTTVGGDADIFVLKNTYPSLVYFFIFIYFYFFFIFFI